jgi:FkbM family methyltransferase
VSAVSYVVDTLVGARRILREQPARGRGPLFFTYLRLRAKLLARRFLPQSWLRRETVFGFHVECFDYTSLVFLFEEIFLHRDYEFATPSERPLILDCGGNIGMATLYFKWLYPQARIASFEPSPQTFAALARNVARNHLPDVRLHNIALVGSAGTVEFYEHEDFPGSGKNSLRPERAGHLSRQVEARPLSEFIHERVDFVKMDIEGAEESVLQELVASGALRLIRQMVIEYHHHIDPAEDRLSHLLSLLEENGFGYQVRVAPDQPFTPQSFQDLLICAYQK